MGGARFQFREMEVGSSDAQVAVVTLVKVCYCTVYMYCIYVLHICTVYMYWFICTEDVILNVFQQIK